MPLGTKVGLSPGHIVLDGAQLPLPKKGGTALNFWPMCCAQTVTHLSYCRALVKITHDIPVYDQDVSFTLAYHSALQLYPL